MTIAQFPSQLQRPSLGPVIRAIRGTQKQEYCASRVGCSRRQWIRWEQNDSQPSYHFLIAIQETFQVTLVSPNVTR